MYSINQNVRWKKIKDYYVITKSDKGQLWRVRHSAAIIWEELIKHPVTLTSLIDTLASIYPDVAVDKLKTDTQKFLQSCINLGILNHK